MSKDKRDLSLDKLILSLDKRDLSKDIFGHPHPRKGRPCRLLPVSYFLLHTPVFQFLPVRGGEIQIFHVHLHFEFLI
jgi:hypothetical protein